jgi:DNA-directed RNA polymerase specialized sigma24 family protein
MTDQERLLDELRPASFAIAYRMLGSVSEAEDVVQEALLWSRPMRSTSRFKFP